MVQVVLRLLIYYLCHILFCLCRVFNEEGSSTMRLARSQRQSVSDLGQSTLQLSRLSGQISGVGIGVALPQTREPQSQQCRQDVDDVGNDGDDYRRPSTVIPDRAPTAISADVAPPKHRPCDKIGDQWYSRDHCNNDKVTMFDMTKLVGNNTLDLVLIQALEQSLMNRQRGALLGPAEHKRIRRRVRRNG